MYNGEDGLYNRFWKEYDRILRHANRTIETDLRLNRATLARLDLARPKRLLGQPLLPDTIQLTLPIGTQARTCTFRSMRPLSDTGQQQTEQVIPAITRPEGYWLHTSTLRQVEDALIADIRNVLDDQHDSYEITSIRYIITDRATIDNLKVPTHQQIQDHAARTLSYKVRCRVDYTYRDSGFLHWSWGDSAWESFDETVTERWEACAYE